MKMNKEVSNWTKGQRTKAALFLAAKLFTIPVGVAAISKLFTGCPNNTTNNGGEEQDPVQREFPITRQFYYRTPGGTLTQYYATVTIVDQTGGSISLEDMGEHNIVSKFHQALDILVERTRENLQTSYDANKALPRGVKVNIVNSAQPFDAFQALNSTTVRVHAEWLSSIQNMNHLNIWFQHALGTLAGMAHDARAKPSNDVRMAGGGAKELIERFDGQQKRKAGALVPVTLIS
jgi:hypothetical protein